MQQEDRSEENDATRRGEGRRLNRRHALGALVAAAGGGAMVLASAGPASAATTTTTNMKLKKADPLTATAVNENFDSIDAQFAGRAVTPDFYKNASDPDDTAAVQAAFDSGKTVIFTRDYYVKSVSMNVDYWPATPTHYQQIDFNGYWLIGVSTSSDSAAMKDCVLEISGKKLRLYNVKVKSDFNVNYRCGVHWRSRTAQRSAEWNTVYGLEIQAFLVGMVYGSHLGETVIDCPQSENTIYDANFLCVQNCLIYNQTNGILTIIGGNLDCGQYEWAQVPNNPYRWADAYCFYVTNAGCLLRIYDCELLKTGSGEGVGFKGSDFEMSNCVIEVGGTWGRLEGKASISYITGGYSGDVSKNMFEIAPSAKGRLLLTEINAHRVDGVIDVAGSYLVNGLTQSPDYRVIIDKSDMKDWSAEKVASSKRGNVIVQNTWFHGKKSNNAAYDVTVNDVPFYSPDGTHYNLIIHDGGGLQIVVA